MFSMSVRYTVRKRQWCYGTAVRARITETVMETDTDERKRNAGNQAYHPCASAKGTKFIAGLWFIDETGIHQPQTINK